MKMVDQREWVKLFSQKGPFRGEFCRNYVLYPLNQME